MTIPDTITIDGPAGAGKSTLGELLAHRLGYLYFDTGVMYRALTWAALGHSVDPGAEQRDAAAVGGGRSDHGAVGRAVGETMARHQRIAYAVVRSLFRLAVLL